MRTNQSASNVKAVDLGAGSVRTGGAYGGDIEFGTIWRRIWDWIVRRAEVQRQRRDLANLTAGEFEDIGVTPEQAWRESRKPFWRD